MVYFVQYKMQNLGKNFGKNKRVQEIIKISHDFEHENIVSSFHLLQL